MAEDNNIPITKLADICGPCVFGNMVDANELSALVIIQLMLFSN
jgi:hypothetical protein